MAFISRRLESLFSAIWSDPAKMIELKVALLGLVSAFWLHAHHSLEKSEIFARLWWIPQEIWVCIFLSSALFAITALYNDHLKLRAASNINLFCLWAYCGVQIWLMKPDAWIFVFIVYMAVTSAIALIASTVRASRFHSITRCMYPNSCSLPNAAK